MFAFLSKGKVLVAAAVAATGLALMAQPASAHGISIGFSLPFVVAEAPACAPAPLYAAPVYAPAPVYAAPACVPAPVVVYSAPVYAPAYYYGSERYYYGHDRFYRGGDFRSDFRDHGHR